jgi:hypothetical protein
MIGIIKILSQWINWPFSLRSVYWCGAFSYIVLLAFPRIFIWPSTDLLIQLIFWGFGAILFAWILAYHASKHNCE